MDSIATLKTLLARAEAERDTAMTVLRQAEALADRARLQAEQLEAYRSEFDQRWTAHFRRSGTPGLLQCQQEFGQRLSFAIGQQRGEVDALGNRVGRARDVLLQREQRVAAVRKLIERREAELRRIADRREQRQTDEAAQRALQRSAQQRDAFNNA